MAQSVLSPASLAPFRTPAVALVLGVLSSSLFIGTAATKTYNGELVEASHFNLFGLVLAGIGAVIAVRWIVRRDADRPLAAWGLSIAAVLVCLVQAGEASEIFTRHDAKRLVTRMTGWPPLPDSHFAGLSPDKAAGMREDAAGLDTGRLVHNIMVNLTLLNGTIARRNAYSAKCYGGMDHRELLPVPADANAGDRKIYDEYVATMQQRPVAVCSDAGTEKNMGELGRLIGEDLAAYQILADEIGRRAKQL